MEPVEIGAEAFTDIGALQNSAPVGTSWTMIFSFRSMIESEESSSFETKIWVSAALRRKASGLGLVGI